MHCLFISRWQLLLPTLVCFLCVPTVGLAGQGIDNVEPSAGDVVESGQQMEGQKNIFHPFLSLQTLSTDNLFNSKVPTGETIAVISPGVWVGRKETRQEIMGLDLLNTAAGGLGFSRISRESERRLQTLFLYRADIEKHQRFPEEDETYHQAQGFIRFQPGSKVSLEILDVFQKSHDAYRTGAWWGLDIYESNLAGAKMIWKPGPKLRFNLDYSLYRLRYDLQRNDFRERDDTTLSLFGFYRIGPKTNIFLGAEKIALNYQFQNSTDSVERRYSLGMDRMVTNRMRGRLRTGFSDKDFSSPAIDNQSMVFGELQCNYAFSEKTVIAVRGAKQTEETDLPGVPYVRTDRGDARLSYRFSPHLSTNMGVALNQVTYQGTVFVGMLSGKRIDNFSNIQWGLLYAYRDWLLMGLAYSREQRNSTFDVFDYTKNTVILTLTATL